MMRMHPRTETFMDRAELLRLALVNLLLRQDKKLQSQQLPLTIPPRTHEDILRELRLPEDARQHWVYGDWDAPPTSEKEVIPETQPLAEGAALPHEVYSHRFSG